MEPAKRDWLSAKLWFRGPVFESPVSVPRCMGCGYRLTEKLDEVTANLDGYICSTGTCNADEIAYYDALCSVNSYRKRRRL